jgi:hypothetical protein
VFRINLVIKKNPIRVGIVINTSVVVGFLTNFCKSSSVMI